MPSAAINKASPNKGMKQTVHRVNTGEPASRAVLIHSWSAAYAQCYPDAPGHRDHTGAETVTPGAYARAALLIPLGVVALLMSPMLLALAPRANNR